MGRFALRVVGRAFDWVPRKALGAAVFSACLALLALAAQAGAQVDGSRAHRFELPAQPLVRTLAAISRAAGVDLQLDAPIAREAQAPALRGEYTVAEALRRVLLGTGLRARVVGGKVRIAGEPDSDAPVYNLRPIQVVGVRNRGYAALRTTTATKTELPLRDAPQSISVVTRDVMADQSMQGMMDVMRLVPGVSMGQGEGHRDAPTIRGNSTTADFFVDGVRDDAQYFRDLYNVERVEVLKGANALVFGRGGGGGVVNRVSKAPVFISERVFKLEGGSYDHKRGTLDLTHPFDEQAAVRVNAVLENSGGFREQARVRRMGVNPTAAVQLGARTGLSAGYEFFRDDRTVDRGIPSFEGRPSSAGRTTYFGNPDSSYSTLRLHTATLVAEHSAGPVTLRNRLRVTRYDKFYANSYPSALNAAGTQVTLAAYNNSTERSNLFNQTDLIAAARTGAIDHTLLLGLELGRQRSDNYRETGYYNNASSVHTTDLSRPTIDVPITFRQSPTDADNRALVSVQSVYAQDQLELSAKWQAIVGLRYDRFTIDFHDKRTASDLSRTDALFSPRAGLLFKPGPNASLYGSYSVSHLPSSGDQFSSLTATTRTLEPERFINLEAGAKWDVRASLSLSAALYQLDRTNSMAPDPADPKKLVQTGSQRTVGFEASAAGDLTPDWHVVAAAAWQNAKITATTSGAPRGRIVPLVPERTFSLWNRYSLRREVSAGFGLVYQDDMYAAIDNAVTLPGFLRADAALFLRLGSMLSAQLNVENLFDEHYFATSHGNNNIMPGAARSIRLSLTTKR